MPVVKLTFSDYLQHDVHLSADKCAQCMHFISNKLPAVLRAYVKADFTDVWEGGYDAEFYEVARKKLLIEPTCGAEMEPDQFALCKQCLSWLAHYFEWQKENSGVGNTGRKRNARGTASTSHFSIVPALTEGEMAEMHIVHRERNQEARARCIDCYCNHHGGRIICEACGFDFGRVYGELGADFIEVHHLCPISQRDEKYQVSPEHDLVPLCANCHAMIHRLLARDGIEGRGALERLRELIASQREKK